MLNKNISAIAYYLIFTTTRLKATFGGLLSLRVKRRKSERTGKIGKELLKRENKEEQKEKRRERKRRQEEKRERKRREKR